jgi:twitching motility protein PilT
MGLQMFDDWESKSVGAPAETNGRINRAPKRIRIEIQGNHTTIRGETVEISPLDFVIKITDSRFLPPELLASPDEARAKIAQEFIYGLGIMFPDDDTTFNGRLARQDEVADPCIFKCALDKDMDLDHFLKLKAIPDDEGWGAEEQQAPAPMPSQAVEAATVAGNNAAAQAAAAAQGGTILDTMESNQKMEAIQQQVPEGTSYEVEVWGGYKAFKARALELTKNNVQIFITDHELRMPEGPGKSVFINKIITDHFLKGMAVQFLGGEISIKADPIGVKEIDFKGNVLTVIECNFRRELTPEEIQFILVGPREAETQAPAPEPVAPMPAEQVAAPEPAPSPAHATIPLVGSVAEPVQQAAAPEPAPPPVQQVAVPEPAPPPVQQVAVPEPAPSPVQQVAVPEPAPPPVQQVANPEPTPPPVQQVVTPAPASIPTVSASPAPVAGDTTKLREYMRHAVEKGASDLHLKAGRPPRIRVAGQLVNIGSDSVTAEMTHSMAMGLLTPQKREVFERTMDVEVACSVEGVGRFRVSIYRQQDETGLAVRCLQRGVPTIESLKLFSHAETMAGKTKGLVLITGTAASGKTSTLAALIDKINRSRHCHIVTIEDPVEYVHTDNQAQIDQREIGRDALDYASGLKHALRQDPDVVLLGEISDHETFSLALTAAESGRLVLASMNATSPAQALARVMEGYPPEYQAEVRIRLAEALAGILWQRLVPADGGQGLTLEQEVLLMDKAVSAFIRENKISQINDAVQKSNDPESAEKAAAAAAPKIPPALKPQPAPVAQPAPTEQPPPPMPTAAKPSKVEPIPPVEPAKAEPKPPDAKPDEGLKSPEKAPTPPDLPMPKTVLDRMMK